MSKTPEIQPTHRFNTTPICPGNRPLTLRYRSYEMQGTRQTANSLVVACLRFCDKCSIATAPTVQNVKKLEFYDI